MPDGPAPVRFVFRGQPVAVPLGDPTRTVLQWLREDARQCGTKEGCAEGDCGACTVLVAELDTDAAATAAAPLPSATGHGAAVRAEGLRIRPVNACIRFLPSLHGKALLTVEDLAPPPTPGGPAPRLHPAQQALVDCHGSQCGFCTPGFVMTMAALHEAHARQPTAPAPDRAALAEGLAGNLCRCTGYRPILDAAQQMLADPVPRLPLAGLRPHLLALQDAPTPATEPGAAPAWQAPRQLDELARLRLAHPEARLLAGGTDIGLWVTKQFRPLGPLIWLGDVAELQQLQATPDGLEIGAAVPLEDAWAALTHHWPALRPLWRRFAGPPVRHAGTLVGNLANGSPIGDAAPVLMALGAALRLRRGSAERWLALQDFYLGYQQNALQPGEFVQSVRVPWLTAPGLDSATSRGWTVQAHKVSKRRECDISAVSAGLALQLGPPPAPGAPPVVQDVRLAFGGMAATVRRAAGAEAALRGQPWTPERLAAAQQALDQDFTPLSDLRASAAYRQRVARALLQRLWLATAEGGAA
ncbi:xanthine dehydrogenase small subunit [Ideonella sp. TBM-1]|uniref:Xanthine dehydrogenase small subunit n=1 Tax=Ideonella livida TaxID=2707176 RepID=A0A7C9PFC7_9BURK|nr:xanthine dehydrogenase small subunit [Ideonella livida]